MFIELTIVLAINGGTIRTESTRRVGVAWKKPEIEEVALGAEINAYYCGELD